MPSSRDQLAVPGAAASGKHGLRHLRRQLALSDIPVVDTTPLGVDRRESATSRPSAADLARQLNNTQPLDGVLGKSQKSPAYTVNEAIRKHRESLLEGAATRAPLQAGKSPEPQLSPPVHYPGPPGPEPLPNIPQHSQQRQRQHQGQSLPEPPQSPTRQTAYNSPLPSIPQQPQYLQQMPPMYFPPYYQGAYPMTSPHPASHPMMAFGYPNMYPAHIARHSPTMMMQSPAFPMQPAPMNANSPSPSPTQQFQSTANPNPIASAAYLMPAQKRQLSKVASALMVGLLDEVMRYEIIPELLMELDWEGNTADNGFGIAVNRVVKKKTPAAQVIAAEFIADVVSEQVRLVISASVRELLDELIQNELASTVVDGILFEAVHDMLPSIVIESMVSAQADVLHLEILEEVLDQQMHVVAADFIRRMNDQRRVAAKCENTRVGEQLAEHMLDRMIIEHLMRVMRDKGPRLVAEDLVDNMVNRWLIQFYVQLFPDGQ